MTLKLSESSAAQSKMGNGGASHVQDVNEKRWNEIVSFLFGFVWWVAPEERGGSFPRSLPVSYST